MLRPDLRAVPQMHWNHYAQLYNIVWTSFQTNSFAPGVLQQLLIITQVLAVREPYEFHLLGSETKKEKESTGI